MEMYFRSHNRLKVAIAKIVTKYLLTQAKVKPSEKVINFGFDAINYNTVVDII